MYSQFGQKFVDISQFFLGNTPKNSQIENNQRLNRKCLILADNLHSYPLIFQISASQNNQF